jgi:hypothetical protein
LPWLDQSFACAQMSFRGSKCSHRAVISGRAILHAPLCDRSGNLKNELLLAWQYREKRLQSWSDEIHARMTHTVGFRNRVLKCLRLRAFSKHPGITAAIRIREWPVRAGRFIADALVAFFGWISPSEESGIGPFGPNRRFRRREI